MESNIVAYESQLELDSTEEQLELDSTDVDKVPLLKAELEEKAYWKDSFFEEQRRRRESDRKLDTCQRENHILKKQVENLKSLLRELPALRREKKELSALITKHEAENESLKTKLEKSETENVKLIKTNRELKTENPQQRHMNGVYKSRRLLEQKNENLASQIEDLKKECTTWCLKDSKNKQLLGMS